MGRRAKKTEKIKELMKILSASGDEAKILTADYASRMEEEVGKRKNSEAQIEYYKGLAEDLELKVKELELKVKEL